MTRQIFNLIRAVFALTFLAFTTVALSEPISHNTLSSGRIDRSNEKTVITISLAPAVPANFSHGTDGPVSNLIENFQGFGTNPAKMAEYMQMEKDIEESEISIPLPSIDYGYTGTLENICIKVNGKDEKDYTTVKLQPEYEGGKKTKNFRQCIGQVTIEKYTRFELKGTFSGGLTNTKFKPIYSDKVDKDYPFMSWRNPNPINLPTVSGSVSGEFYILDPWRSDDRFELDENDFIDAAESDLKGKAANYGIDIDVDKVFDEVRKNQQQNDHSKQLRGCNCGCNSLDKTISRCKIECKLEYAACKDEENKSEEEPTITDIVNKDIDEAELRKKFIVQIKKNFGNNPNLPASVMDNMLKGFDSMPNLEGKKMIYFSQGGKL